MDMHASTQFNKYRFSLGYSRLDLQKYDIMQIVP